MSGTLIPESQALHSPDQDQQFNVDRDEWNGDPPNQRSVVLYVKAERRKWVQLQRHKQHQQVVTAGGCKKDRLG